MDKKLNPIFGLFKTSSGFVVYQVSDVFGSNSPSYFDDEKSARNFIRKLVNKKLTAQPRGSN